jgi:hypothetical protein
MSALRRKLSRSRITRSRQVQDSNRLWVIVFAAVLVVTLFLLVPFLWSRWIGELPG